MVRVTLFDIFFTFLRVGAFTLGGGLAMLPMIRFDVVDRKKWLDESLFWDMVALSQGIPGIMAVNVSLFTGYRLRGVKGALCGALGTIIPSFVIILVVAAFLAHFRDLEVVDRIFTGLRPAVAGMIAAMVVSAALSRKPLHWQWIAIVAVAVCIGLLNVSPLWFVLPVVPLVLLYTQIERVRASRSEKNSSFTDKEA